MLRLAAALVAATSPPDTGIPEPSVPDGVQFDNIISLVIAGISIVALIALALIAFPATKRGDVRGATNSFVVLLIVGVAVIFVIGGLMFVAPGTFLDFLFNQN